MKKAIERSARGRQRLCRNLALAGAAVALPVVAHALIQRRRREPQAPGWGRAHRYSGRLGPVVFQELGAGPPIVLLHAFGPGFDASQWRAAAEALAPHFRVLAPDLPGWGRSAPLAPRPEAYLASLGDFLGGVAWGRAILVAAGAAAPYAIHLAAERPDLVRGVALVAPRGLPGLHAGGAGRQAAAPASPRPGHALRAQLLQVPWLWISILDVLTSRAALAAFLRNRAYAAPERVDAALLDHHYRVSHLPAHRLALAAYWRGELHLPAAAALRHLSVPLWVGLGGESGANPRRRPAADALPPDAHVEVIEGTRALPHAEKPLAVSQALAHFAAQLPD